MKKIHCGFIGLGLIGGSIAKALKEKRTDIKISAYDINSETLSLAYKEGIADYITNKIDATFSDCDILFLCAPVSCNDDNLLLLKQYLPQSCILTDVGSVKGEIHKQIDALGLNHIFIGGHPMAGSERYGYSNSNATLLENAYYILTPTTDVREDALAFYKELIISIDAIPLVMSHTKHDYITAAVSHLPHVIASSLVNLVQDSDSDDGVMKMIAAGGFKDITRIASSSPHMWQQICLTNIKNISDLLTYYIDTLSAIKEQIDAKKEQDIYHFFDRARTYRDSFIDASSGPIKKVFSLHLDIADEAGTLAPIATMLAANGISIKNLGITHSREKAEGTLLIEFYDEDSLNQAISILEKHNYHIYKK